MTPRDLLAAFETLANAPDGIDRLRNLVLQFAMRGKLVAQDPTDEPATELLERISAEKARMVEQKIIRRSKAHGKVDADAEPFAVPTGWTWSQLGFFCHVEMGQSPPSKFYNQSGDGMPFFQGKADFGEMLPTARYWCVQPKKLAFSGDVLLSVRAPVGPTNIADMECCIGRGLAALR